MLKWCLVVDRLQQAGHQLRSTTCEQCPPAHAAAQPSLPHRLQAQLAAQRAEAEAAAARSLQFIDRVMADKEALAGRQESGWQGGGLKMVEFVSEATAMQNAVLSTCRTSHDAHTIFPLPQRAARSCLRRWVRPRRRRPARSKR